MKSLKQFLLITLAFLPLGLYAQATITSDPAGTSNWSLTTTWVGGIVPTSTDNVVIATSHAVVVNVTSTIKDLTINGTLSFSTTATPLTLTGNLAVSNTGVLNAFNGTTGKAINVAGNIVNDGTIDFSKTSTLLTLNGTNAQTVSGIGVLISSTIILIEMVM